MLGALHAERGVLEFKYSSYPQDLAFSVLLCDGLVLVFVGCSLIVAHLTFQIQSRGLHAEINKHDKLIIVRLRIIGSQNETLSLTLAKAIRT